MSVRNGCIGSGVDIETISFKNMTATTLEERSELVKMILPQVQAKGAIH